MKPLKIVLTTMAMLLALTVHGEGKDIPARLKTEIVQLKYIELTKPLEEMINSIIDDDYSGNASYVYDKNNNSLVITATNISIEKIKRLINKIDVKGESVFVKIYLLAQSKKGDDSKNLPPFVREKLGKISVKKAKILATSTISTKTGKSVFVALKDPDYGTTFEISFFLSGKADGIGLNFFKIFKLTKEKNNIYNRWKIIESSYDVSEKDPLILGITGDNGIDYVFVITATK